MTKLKPITVLLTAAGCPGASTCIRYLQGISERRVRVVGVDAAEECIGKFFTDGFYQIPLATAPDYLDQLLEIALKEKVDCIIVASSYEVEIVAAGRRKFADAGIPVLVSSSEALSIANACSSRPWAIITSALRTKAQA